MPRYFRPPPPPPPTEVFRLALALPTSVTWLWSRPAEAGRYRGAGRRGDETRLHDDEARVCRERVSLGREQEAFYTPRSRPVAVAVAPAAGAGCFEGPGALFHER